MESDEMRIERLENEKAELLSLLRETLNSDMAAREEDEGNVSALLEKVRITLKKFN
jgi:hypothetical protein